MVEKTKSYEVSEKNKDSLNPNGDMAELRKQIIWPKIQKIVEEALFLNPTLDFWLTAKYWVNKYDEIINYIIEWNLKSWKDVQLEKYIEGSSQHPMAWKLKFLIDNAKNPLEVTIAEIEEKEKKNREKNNQMLKELEQKSAKYQASQEKSILAKWWEWLTDKVKWIGAHFVNLADVPEKIGWVIGDVLTKAEEYIWRPYRSWSLDCSWFLSKIFSTWQWKEKMDRWVAKNFADRYKKVDKNEIRCWDVIYQAKPAHVELIVSKPYVENGITYVMTVGSSTDDYSIDPMFDAKWNPIKGKTWVWYRKRQIAPNPRHPYTYHRPPYEEWAKKRT